jgi:hypothetical protein
MGRASGNRSAGRARRGQSLVEFALVFPIFIMIVFGLIDAGRYVYMNIVLSQAAREGARVAAVEASWIGSSNSSCGTTGGPTCPGAVTGASNSLQKDVTDAANRMVAPFGAVKDVYFSCQPVTATNPPGNWTNTDCAVGNRAPNQNVVWVRVDLTFTPITPVISSTWTFTTSGSATMVIN